MSKIIRVLKISILFILFTIFVFIISILIFFILDKYNLFDNKIIKFLINLLVVIIGSWFMLFLIEKIHQFYVVILIPAMKWTLDFSRTNYHWIKGDGLRAIDIEDSDMRLSISDEEVVIKMTLELKDYSRKENRFKIRVYLPESISLYTDDEFYDFENHYYTHGRRSISNIREDITIKLNNNYEGSQLFDSKWDWEDVEYELYSD